MKFVHLAPRTAISRITRSGIRLGGGRRGRGVYSVPLFRLVRRSFKDDSLFSTAVDLSVPLTTATLWCDLFGSSRNRGSRPIAVVFEPPPSCWPIDLFLSVAPSMAGPFLAALARTRQTGLDVTRDDLDFVADATRKGFHADLKATAYTARAIGRLLRLFITCGGAAWSHHDDTLEAVLRSPVPAAAICRLFSLSQPSRKPKRTRKISVQHPDDEDAA